MMEIRAYRDTDYETVCSWWKEWGQTCIPEDCLPEMGAIVEVNRSPAVCAWLFRMDCKMCWIGFPISTKKFRGKQRKEAIALLFNTLCGAAKGMGYKFVNSICNTSSLQARYKESRFVECDKNIFHMIRSI